MQDSNVKRPTPSSPAAPVTFATLATLATLAGLVLLGCVAGCASSSERAVRRSLPAPAPASDPTTQWAATSLTVGDLLAKGGRQLNAAQVKTALAGAVMEGVAGNMSWREMSFPDGKVTGQSKMSEGLVIDYQGSWWVDEQGRRCWMNSQQRSPAPACVYLYFLDGSYYAAEQDASRRNARLEARRIRK